MASSQENVGGSRVPMEQRPLQNRATPILKASLTLLVNAVPLCSALVVPMAAPLGAMANGTGTDTAQETPVDRSVSSVNDFQDPPPASPKHWAYGHLEEWVQVHQCVAGFYSQSTGERTFRGEQPATRFEMVALLKSCLDKLPTTDPTDSRGCSGGDSGGDSKSGQRVTTLIIRNNDALTSLEFSDLKNLTKLVIKNNKELTKLTVPESHGLYELANITIDNNNKLENTPHIQTKQRYLSDVISENWKNIIPNIKNIFLWPFNRELSLFIKRNDCLKDLNLKNLNNLKELRIESNDNLTEIKLNGQQASNGQASTNPSASPPVFLFSRVLMS